MKPMLFKTPGELESFIRSLPVPKDFGQKNVDEMIALGTEMFVVRQTIAKGLLGNTKGFDKYAEILAKYVKESVDDTVGEDLNKLNSRLKMLEESVTKFDGFFDKLSMTISQETTRKNIEIAQGVGIDISITNFGSAIEDLYLKAKEVQDSTKKLQAKVLDQSLIKDKINERTKKAYEKSTRSTLETLSSLLETVAFLFKTKPQTEEMVKKLRRYCDLQIKFNRCFMK